MGEWNVAFPARSRLGREVTEKPTTNADPQPRPSLQQNILSFLRKGTHFSRSTKRQG